MSGLDTDGVTCVGCGVAFERDHYHGNYCPDCRTEWEGADGR